MGDRASLKWEADPGRPKPHGLGRTEEWTGSGSSSDSRGSQRLPRSLAAGDQHFHVREWKEGGLESPNPWRTQITSFSKT